MWKHLKNLGVEEEEEEEEEKVTSWNVPRGARPNGPSIGPCEAVRSEGILLDVPRRSRAPPGGAKVGTLERKVGTLPEVPRQCSILSPHSPPPGTEPQVWAEGAEGGRW